MAGRITLRDKICGNKRWLHRRIFRYLLISAVCLLLLSNVMHVFTWFDRRQIKHDFLLQRQMLDSRAKIQMTLYGAGKRRGVFTPEETAIVESNWGQAEYDRAK